MSKSNPFTTAEDSEESSMQSNQEPSQPGEKEAGEKEVGGEEVSKLKAEIQELRGEVKELRGVMEPEPPEPDYECNGEECDGFAVEEVEPGHVTTRSTMFKNDRPETVECPRCGKEMSPDAFIPKEEQQAMLGVKPLKSNSGAAGRTLAQRFEEEGREDVLESAEKE